MLKAILALAVIAVASSVQAQELTIPKDAPTNHKFNKDAVAAPNESCSSQKQQCGNGCISNRKLNEQTRCARDCEERLAYCRRTGFQLNIRGPSLLVGSRE